MSGQGRGVASSDDREAYRGYLICRTIGGQIWVERDRHLICWASDVAQAKAQINGLVDWAPADPADPSTSDLVVAEAAGEQWAPIDPDLVGTIFDPAAWVRIACQNRVITDPDD
jgi:hypothetical protein